MLLNERYTVLGNSVKDLYNHIPLNNTPSFSHISYSKKFFSRKDNTFSVSFKKFHVTKIQKSGYNKIYENHHSKSFFFEIVDQIENTNQIHLKIHTNDLHMSTTPIKYNSTSVLPNAKYQISKSLQHFFLAQKVIPKCIQHKYFDLIRKKLLDRIMIIKSRAQKTDDRNYSTKTFFNFSYKWYHFYFGIFIPCGHDFPPCSLPSLIVMSNNRYGCGKHFYSDNPPTYRHQMGSNNKNLHANICFRKWFNQDKKEIFSNRLGIKYSTSYHAKGHKYIFNKKSN
ncbi:hypothetical protein C1646_292720 [Rhizophagus diaphanus]|nr:hypothetical protein C1646_292720 [Rhizophagus diaphanus] [Rhizophagus sp. MUCL 43196]